MTASAFLAAWFLHLLAAASPGPTILMAARTGVTAGPAAGAMLALGCAIGAAVWAVAAWFGLALLFQVAPTLLWGLKVAGGLFLMWIAWQMWTHARAPMAEAPAAGLARSARGALTLGLVTQMSNPKPAVFFGAVFVGTLPPDASAPAMLLLLAVIFANEFACTLGVARLFALARVRAAYARLKTVIDRSFGGVLGLMGARIATT